MGAPGGSASPSPSPSPTFVTTIVVSPGSSAAASGTALLQALAAISDSNTTPLLLKIEPGIYDVGGNVLTSKPNVDIEGSGPEVTTITGANSGPVLAQPIVLIQNDVGFRDLKVVNTSSGMHTSAVNLNAANANLKNLVLDASAAANGDGLHDNSPTGAPTVFDVQATGGPTGNGIFTNGAASIWFDRVTATGGTAIRQLGGFKRFTNVFANGTNSSLVVSDSDPRFDGLHTTGAVIGINNLSGTHSTFIRNSVLGTDITATQAGGTLTVNIADSQIDGAISGAGLYKCNGNYDNALANKSCP
jgi:hypothetical protein